jgi:hypothetical protein
MGIPGIQPTSLPMKSYCLTKKVAQLISQLNGHLETRPSGLVFVIVLF